MPSLTLRNPLRRNPSRPSLRDRAAALRATAAKLIQRPKPKVATSTPDEAGAILDAILVSRVQELVATEASQDATLRATSFADAYDSPEWVEMERERETILAQVTAAQAHTIEGMKAKATLLDLGSVKHFQEPFERLTQSIAADAAALGVFVEGPPDTQARTLLAAIEREWAVFEALLGVNSEPTDDATMDAAMERQAVLLRAAADLPAASREARHTKALALAWIVSTDLMERGKVRDDYATDGRLVFDIMTSIADAESA